MARTIKPATPALEKLLQQLGENIRLARLRRRLSTTMLAERAGMTRNTLRSIERGDGGVTLGAYAGVLMSLGLENDLGLLAKDDLFGRKLQDAGMANSKRRSRSKAKPNE